MTPRFATRTLAWAVAFLVLPGGAGAQTPPKAVASIAAVRTDEPPDIDGVIEADEWKGAATVTSFTQFQPQRGERPARDTTASILYDATHIYVSFHCRDDEPVTAQLTQRDADLFSDDAVSVLLDTAFDRQTAYYFRTNPLGTQADGRLIDDGRQADGAWDAPWMSAAVRTSDGWSAEFAIPFASLKYVAGPNITWGINLVRARRRTLEIDTWAFPLDIIARVSQAGQLTGLDVAPQGRRHQVIPYALGSAQRGSASEGQAGIDARYNITSQTALYATLNPDFALIEADVEEVNLTRFEVSLPEKRQFFLEGNELYGQRIRTFYSRRIADILGGGKLLGKTGPWTTALMSVVTDPIGGQGRANFTVARVQRDVGRSSVGVTTGNRHLAGQNNGSVSMDTNVFLSRTWGVTAQAVQSWGQYGHGATALFVRPSYDSPTGHFHVRYTQLGNRVRENLNPVGRVPDDDRREIDSAIEKTFWVRSGAFERIQYDSNYNAYWGMDGGLRNWQVDESVEVEFRNRWSAEVSWTEEFARFEKDFRNRQVGFGLGYNTREFQSASVGVEVGRNFDADFVLWNGSAKYKLTDALSAEYSLERLVLTPDLEGENTWIHVLRANQFFSKDLFVRLLVQTNSAIERNNVQAVFVWRYRPPFGALQVAYQRGTAAFGERSAQGHTLFVKMSTVF